MTKSFPPLNHVVMIVTFHSAEYFRRGSTNSSKWENTLYSEPRHYQWKLFHIFIQFDARFNVSFHVKDLKLNCFLFINI